MKLNPAYKSRASVRIGALTVKGSVRGVVRAQFSDSADCIGEADGLPYRLPAEIVSRAGLYGALTPGTQIVIETADGDNGDIATAVSKR